MYVGEYIIPTYTIFTILHLFNKKSYSNKLQVPTY